MIIKILNYDLLHASVKLGQIYYVTDRRCLYKDFGKTIEERRRYPAYVINTEEERASKIRPVNGMNYYVIESSSLWEYDSRWVLKEGSPAIFNTYIYNNGVSPVIIDDHITSSTSGDRIIDNNGLLGDGSVVVRDENRITRAKIEAHFGDAEIKFHGFMSNGITFYPYSIAQTPGEKLRYGGLQLGVSLHNNSDNTLNGDPAVRGVANYYGDFNIHGNCNQVIIENSLLYSIWSLPERNQTIQFKFQSFGHKEEDDSIIVLYTFDIEVIDKNNAIINITESTNNGTHENPEMSNSYVVTDYVYNRLIRYDARREEFDDRVEYTLVTNSLDSKFVLKPPKDSVYSDKSIPVQIENPVYHIIDSPKVCASMVVQTSYSLIDEIRNLNTRYSQTIKNLQHEIDTLKSKLEG